MTVVVSPMPNAFAGEVLAIDCAKPLDGRDIDASHEGMAKHAVLVFRDQPLRGRSRQWRADFSNPTRSGSVTAPDDRIWLFKLGGRLWHSDSSFRRSQPFILCCPGEPSRLTVERQNSRTCAPPMTRSTTKQKLKSRISFASTRSIPARRSAFSISYQRS